MLIQLCIRNMDFESGQEIGLDPELEDVRAVIHSICEIVHDHNVASFSVSCGDEEAWPVDVLFDLPTFLEQLPETLELLRNNADTIAFDFYEQGIERVLFHPKWHFRQVSDVVRFRVY